jgi:hypothetical protein
MSPTGTGVASKPTIFPFAPLFRDARPFVLRPSASAAPSALPVRSLTVIPSLEADMPPRQILLDGAILFDKLVAVRFDAPESVLAGAPGRDAP